MRRRRECLNCEFRFTTYERVETMTITVVKRSGTRETFSRSKLLTGLVRACEKTGLETNQKGDAVFNRLLSGQEGARTGGYDLRRC